MNASTARRPSIRLDRERRARSTDLDAHRPDCWPPILPGQSITVRVGFGLSVDTAETALLARHVRAAMALRIAGRTDEACRTARALLTALWRADDGGAS